MGSGDEPCLNLETAGQFAQTCSIPEATGHKVTCYSEFVADWTFNGRLQYILTRGCKRIKDDADNETCRSGYTGGFYFRDCSLFCSSNNCNVGTETLFGLHAVKDENGDIREPNECRSCCTRNNSETGLMCMTDPIDLPNGSIKCPKYANAGCFNANFHQQGIVQPDKQEYSKGCSPFMFEDEKGRPDSNGRCQLDGNMEACKSTCNYDGCNTGAITDVAMQCYTCSVTVREYKA